MLGQWSWRRRSDRGAEPKELDALIVGLAQSSTYDEIGRRLHEQPVLLSDAASGRLERWRSQVVDPALRLHLERLAFLVQTCRDRGVDAVIAELTSLDELVTMVGRSEGSGPAFAAAPTPTAFERVLVRSDEARGALRALGEELFFEPSIEQIQGAGADGWIGVLLASLGADPNDPTNFYQEGRERRVRLTEQAMAAISSASGIDCRGLPVEWVHLDSPNALAIHAEDGGEAIGIDQLVIGQLALIAAAGIAAMARGGDRSVVRTAETLHRVLRLGHVDETGEQHLLEVQEAVSDFAWMIDGFWQTSFEFVLAHEVGHVALGHFDTSNAPLRLMLEDDAQPVEVSCFPSHELEHQADAWALEQVRSIAKQNGTTHGAVLSQTAPAGYFAAAELLETVAGPSTTAGQASVRSHPPPWDRVGRLRPEVGPARAIAAVPEFDLIMELPDYLHSLVERERMERAEEGDRDARR